MTKKKKKTLMLDRLVSSVARACPHHHAPRKSRPCHREGSASGSLLGNREQPGNLRNRRLREVSDASTQLLIFEEKIRGTLPTIRQRNLGAGCSFSVRRERKETGEEGAKKRDTPMV